MNDWLYVTEELDVPVTVYVVVTLGEATTLTPVVADKPVAGDHV